MKLVDSMMEQPGMCIACGSTPTDVEGNVLPAIDCEVEVNWGDALYICIECASVICDLLDRPTKEQVEKVRSRIKFVEKRNAEMAKEIEEKDDVLEKIRKGREAIRKVRKSG